LHFSDLQLTHFRNYYQQELRFSPGINCFVGANGSGKTNLLDALHFLALTRGFRSTQDKFAVKKGETYFFNGATLIKDNAHLKINVNYLKGRGKKVIFNQKPLVKMSEHIGRVPLVAILPHDTELINGPSAGRRRFLDMLIAQYDPSYLNHLIQYDKIIAQRNALLKLMGEQRFFDKEQVEIWDSQLIPHGIAIHQGRKVFLQDFMPYFEDFFKKIVSNDEAPHIEYKSHVKENTIDGWLALLAEHQERDRVQQYTTGGTHRDDLTFRIDEQSARNFGSQGQQKTFVISLKLAQYRLLEQQTGIAPILLLDDIFDKLDEHRLQSIANLLDRDIEGQTFITDTSYERMVEVFSKNIQREVKYFSVKDGVAEER
jgi:DNA replication and repair protein RecF